MKIRNIIFFAALQIALPAGASATEFETFNITIFGERKIHRSDIAVLPDGRYINLYTADVSVGRTGLFAVTSDNQKETTLTQLLDLSPTQESLSDRLDLEIATGGGKTWAFLGRNLDGGSSPEYGFLQIYPEESRVFIPATNFRPRSIDLAVGDDGLPRACLSLSSGITVVKLGADGQVSTGNLIEPRLGELFDQASIALATGQIAISAGSLSSSDTGESWLRQYQGSEEAFFGAGPIPSPSLVTTDADVSAFNDRVVMRLRSVFLDGAISPVILYHNGIEEQAKLAVRDPSLGWQNFNLPTIDGVAPRGLYVDIAADSRGRGHLTWSTISSTAYGTYSVGGSISGELVPALDGVGLSIDVGSRNAIALAGLSGEQRTQTGFLKDLSDLDRNGFSVLQEEAFGIAPGDANPDRAPWPTIFSDDGRSWPAITYWRRPGGGGSHPYIVDDLEYYVEYSGDLKNWFSSAPFTPVAESFTITGRGQLVTQRALIDFASRNGGPAYFRVRVERIR